MTTREEEAGRLYNDGRKAVRAGGHELHSLAMHLILMINGTQMPHFPGPLWPLRQLPPDGKIIQLDRFIDYLLKPAREGLQLPSLYFLQQALEATPRDGERALALVRAELKKEHVDFDDQARRDELRLHGERAPAKAVGKPKAVDNVDNVNIRNTGGGNSAAYLAARLRRDHPDIAERLAAGEFKSVRAAARAAGISKETGSAKTDQRIDQ